ncbi:hypothetical protein APT_02082 [Acetobacter pasteurianus NBRC 101655]|nr:hypothetical protein APT_02082 [Acetobacter pasteurianus NBRC 101655]
MSVRCLMQNLSNAAQQMRNSIQLLITCITHDCGTLSGMYGAMASQSFTALCFRVSQLALLLGGADTCCRAQEGFADHQDDSCARLNILSWPWDRSLYRASSPLQSSRLLQWPLLRSFGRKQWLRQTLNSSLVRFFARRTMDDGGRHGNVPPDSYSFDFERKMNDRAAA